MPSTRTGTLYFITVALIALREAYLVRVIIPVQEPIAGTGTRNGTTGTGTGTSVADVMAELESQRLELEEERKLLQELQQGNRDMAVLQVHKEELYETKEELRETKKELQETQREMKDQMETIVKMLQENNQKQKDTNVNVKHDVPVPVPVSHPAASRSKEDRKSFATTNTERAERACKKMFMDGIEPLSVKSNQTGAWQTKQCDRLFCDDNNGTGTCKWSYFAIDTLLESTGSECSDNPAHVERFFLKPEWNIYRFGDYLRGVRRNHVEEIPQLFPDSIIAEMDPNVTERRNGGEQSQEAMRVVDNRLARMSPSEKLPPNTLVIHLRLGDTVDGDEPHSVRDLLYEQQYYFRTAKNGTNIQCNPWWCPYNDLIEVEGNKYVKSLSYYSDQLLKLQTETTNDNDNDPNELPFTSVIILGAAHAGMYTKRTAVKSCQYTAAIQAYVQRWIKKTESQSPAVVTLQLGNFPDDDILTAAQASRFIQGGGGFSRKLAEIHNHVQEQAQLEANKN